MKFTITSTAFEDGGMIPKVHTSDGDDVSPPLAWEGEPGGTASFALIVEDPEAPGGTFAHWIVYNLPPYCHSLEKIIPIEKKLNNGAIQGKNDFGKTGYRGPSPPSGEEHVYTFRLFALRKKLRPETANTGRDFYLATNGLVIDRAEYTGKYRRK